MSVNKVILVGHLGQNPEIRYTTSGMPVAHFSIATSESWMDKTNQKQEKTEWHRIVVWGKVGENCAKYLSKGRQVYIEGRLQTRQWQDKEGQTKHTTEIQAQTVQFLGAGTAASSTGAGSQPYPSTQQSASSDAGSASSFESHNPYQTSPALASRGPTSPSMDSLLTEEDMPF